MIAAVVAGIILPCPVFGHGETEIQIAAVTREIETATNNLAELYLRRGELHREHRNWQSAEADYASAEKLSSGSAAVNLCRGMLLFDSGDLNGARATLDKAIQQAPSNGNAWLARARVVLNANDTKSALRDFDEALKVTADLKPEYFLDLARALTKEGMHADAVRVLDCGIKKLGPVLALEGCAIDIELSQNNAARALTRLDALLKHAPRTETWWTLRGEILLRMQRLKEARQSFKSALIAIDALPPRLQQSPSMPQLQTRIRSALTTIKTESTSAARASTN